MADMGRRTMVPDDGEIAATILRLVAERGADKTVCPSEVARTLGGSDEKVWRLLMQPVRRVAIRLAGRGEVAILRKGKRVPDLDALKGIYRLGAARDGSA